MIWYLKPVIPFHPYPTGGGGYRCFDGEKWVDCDKDGQPLRRERKDDG